MDSILMTEEPLIRKCCCVIPLRFCLQTWAFIKLAADLAAIGFIAVQILMMLGFGGSRALNFGTLLVALMGVALAFDVGFLILLTVGIFKKSIKLIRVFYIYEWVAMAVETSFIIFLLVNTAKAEMHAGGIVIIVIGISYILLDLCIILTLKSEIVKLRNKDQFDFNRLSREGDMTGKLNIEDSKLDE